MYFCSVEGCEYECKNLTDMKNHEVTHNKEQAPFKCEICSYGCLKEKDMINHMNSHNNVRPYKCEICFADFVTSSGLRRHEKTHKSEKIFSCTLCTFTSNRADDFKNHQLRHQGKLPFFCDEPGCEYECVRSDQLARHKKTHTGEKPHICQLCGFTCITSSALQKHTMSIHTGERRFKCTYPMCGYASVDNHNLKLHIEAMHSEDGIKRQKKQEQRVYKLLSQSGFIEFIGDRDISPPIWQFRREFRIDFKCVGDMGKSTCAKIDFLISVPTGLIFLEVDENQHKFGYTVPCDMKRMSNVMESLFLGGNTQPVLWLRYNPHAYQIDFVTQRKSKASREAWLKDRLLTCEFSQTNDKDCMMSIEYAYYDSHGGLLNVLYDPEYHADYKNIAKSVG